MIFHEIQEIKKYEENSSSMGFVASLEDDSMLTIPYQSQKKAAGMFSRTYFQYKWYVFEPDLFIQVDPLTM